METEIETHCFSYSKYNAVQYLRATNTGYKYFVDTVFHYRDIKKTKCYDANGVYLGFFEHKPIIRDVKEDREVRASHETVIQINYNFHIIPCQGASTIDQLAELDDLLTNTFNIKTERISVGGAYSSLEAYHRDYLDLRYEEFDAIEYCAVGHSREVANKVGMKLINLDIKEYTKRKNEFINKNPDWEEAIERLYKMNIGFLMEYFQVSRKKILKDNFCRKTAMINKLHRKINKSINN